ncbi:hypothetical protein G4B88_004993 [Cannabis sativa]|uniref:Uncharacterized protein n=1 Tax=Cannabis sativa TaxID=3483 RepID=A0A7J6FAM7_CANSA|nr:hypothetical protein G4B88_004993 [Cannabis sativa]
MGRSSSDRVLKTNLMDVILEITELEVEEKAEEEHDEEEQVEEEGAEEGQSATRKDFSGWLNLANRSAQDVELGKISIPPLFSKVKITSRDIEDELNYWKPSIVGYVAEANLPLNILEGFAKRIWKEDVVKVDDFTKHRDRLIYPRILIEASLTQAFPREISLIDEFDHDVYLEVKYEWLPIICKSCVGMGHETRFVGTKPMRNNSGSLRKKLITKKKNRKLMRKAFN